VSLRGPRLVASCLLPLIALAALPACGGGAVSPEAYVRSVCQAVADWQGEIQERSTDLEQSLGADATPEQGKEALGVFLDGVITDTDRMIELVDEAGTPEIDDGEATANRLTEALRQVQEAFRDAREEVDALPTSSPEEFQEGADQLGSSIQSAFSDAGTTLEQESPQLDPIFEREPACDELSA
jgi:hypothetical protein